MGKDSVVPKRKYCFKLNYRQHIVTNRYKGILGQKHCPSGPEIDPDIEMLVRKQIMSTSSLPFIRITFLPQTVFLPKGLGKNFHYLTSEESVTMVADFWETQVFKLHPICLRCG